MRSAPPWSEGCINIYLDRISRPPAPVHVDFAVDSFLSFVQTPHCHTLFLGQFIVGRGEWLSSSQARSLGLQSACSSGRSSASRAVRSWDGLPGFITSGRAVSVMRSRKTIQCRGRKLWALRKLTEDSLPSRCRAFRLFPRPLDLGLDRAAVPHHSPVARYQDRAVPLQRRAPERAGTGSHRVIRGGRPGPLLHPYDSLRYAPFDILRAYRV